MVRRQESSNTNSKASLRIWLVAGVSSIVLAAVVLTLTTRTVHANAPLATVSATEPQAHRAGIASHLMLAPAIAPESEKSDLLHGLASWYGSVFNGRQTASGELFDMYAMTACHPTLPFGTLVRVINLENQRSVVVRITDRGYLYEGRVIDLSFAAAEKLSMTKAGLARVKLEVVSLGRVHPNQ